MIVIFFYGNKFFISAVQLTFYFCVFSSWRLTGLIQRFVSFYSKLFPPQQKSANKIRGKTTSCQLILENLNKYTFEGYSKFKTTNGIVIKARAP